MDSSIANYVFFIGGLLIVSALALYVFFPKLRKNSFKLEDFPEPLPLKERYKNEIASGDALIIKGTGKKSVFTRFFLPCLLLFLFYLIFFQFSSLLHDCVFNEKLTLKLFFRDSLGFLTGLTYLIMFLQYAHSIYSGKKTGLTDNPNKKFSEDTIIEKYSQKHFKDDLFSLMLGLVMLAFVIYFMPNWEIINKSSSFSEANKIAYEQCMADKKHGK